MVAVDGGQIGGEIWVGEEFVDGDDGGDGGAWVSPERIRSH